MRLFPIIVIGASVLPLAKAPSTILRAETAASAKWQNLEASSALVFAKLSPSLARASQPSQLSLADRIGYQRAIEEVYWRHRIWPKERPDPKPSLNEVMSSAQLEKKVEDNLRNSEALADYWGEPLRADQLQAEMERMAQHTKQPEMLRELFEALGNDPYVIAECLARPVLSERLIAHLPAQDTPRRLESARTKGVRNMLTVRTAGNATYTLPKISDGDPPCSDDTWTTTSINAPDARYFHTAVWTGSEMIIWGGYNGSDLNTGGRYNPSTDSWVATSTTNAPSGRQSHTAVWTGTEMIVWGGQTDTGDTLSTGGRYNPGTDTWTATSTANATARTDHTAVWTGTQMLVWGGLSPSYSNTGGRYNPVTDDWAAISTNNAPSARYQHAAVWSGSEMIVWGGYYFDGTNHYLNTGGRYNPNTDTWTATSIVNVPAGRQSHTAVWSGSEMIVWGGYYFDGVTHALNTGGRYNPGTDSWTATSTTGAAAARWSQTAVSTDSEMIVWGGFDGSNDLNTGGRYNPSSNTWTNTSTTNAPGMRYGHTAVWSGSEMIVWGGQHNFNYLNTGGRYCLQTGPPPTPTPTATATPTATQSPTPASTRTPTPTATFTPTPVATVTATATATSTETPSVTPTATPILTPRPTPTARPDVTPRPRSTPPPRP